MGNGEIQLHATPNDARIHQDDVYFAFASGRFAYDCHSCGAQCCRGHGYLAHPAKELKYQLERKSLPLFLDADASGLLRVRNAAPACFFLSNDNRCEIHAVHGYAAKPETCRLFPFNQICRLGKYLIVTPHDFLCPIDVVPPSNQSALSDHRGLLDSMRAAGIFAQVPSCTIGEEDPGPIIARERELINLSERFLGNSNYIAFAEAQLRHDHHGRDEEEQKSTSLGNAVELMRDILGLPPTVMTQGSELTQVMIAVTPYLRSRLLFRRMTTSAKGPQSVVRPIVDTSRIPYAMVCIYLLAEAAKTAGMKRVTFQTVSRLGTEFAPLVHVLSNVDRVMMWQRGAMIDPRGPCSHETRLRFLRLVKDLLPRIQRKVRIPLGELLLRHTPADPVARGVFLRQVTGLLSTKIVPLENGSFYRPGSKLSSVVVSATQGWVLTHLGEEVVVSAYDRFKRTRDSA